MWELTAKLEQLPAWEFAMYLGELQDGRPPVSLAPLVASKPQMEDQGKVDEEGGYVYDCIKMLYEENFCPQPMLTQGMEDAIVLVSSLSPSCLKQYFLAPQQSCLLTNVTFLPLISEHEGSPPLEWETNVGGRGKVHILVVICSSLPVSSKEAALLWAAGVPKPDAIIITGVTISSWEEPGTSTEGITPQGPRICIGAPTLLSCWITPDFLHPLALPANCLPASDWDSASNTKTESDSSNSSGREPSNVHPHPQIFRTWARISH